MNFLQKKPLQQSSKLLFILVNRWDLAKILLGIRNECREGMTHHTDEITLDQQKEFYEKHLHPETGDGKYLAYLLLGVGVYGYAGLREEGERYWMTIGVSRNNRGLGYSDLLTHLITEMGIKRGKEVWLDVWKDSFVVKVYENNGYEIMEESQVDGRSLLTMKYKG